MALRREALLAIRGFNLGYSARGRRRGRALAAAGAQLEDRLCRRRARLASPPVVGEVRLKAGARHDSEGERWLMAHHPEKFRFDGRIALARAHLQPAAVRAIALGRAHQLQACGARRRSRRPIAATCIRFKAFLPHPRSDGSCAIVRLRARRSRHGWSPACGNILGGRAASGLTLGGKSNRHRGLTIAKDVSYALRSDVDSLPGQLSLYCAHGCASALPPAARAHPRPDSRRPVAAANQRRPLVAAQNRAADPPVPAPARSVARARQLVSGAA